MTKFMFISTHNYWFSLVARVSALVFFIGWGFNVYNYFTSAEIPYFDAINFYLTATDSCIIVGLTSLAWYLHHRLSYKPFCISLAMAALLILKIVVAAEIFALTFNLDFLPLLVDFILFILAWKLSFMTRPRLQTLF